MPSHYRFLIANAEQYIRQKVARRHCFLRGLALAIEFRQMYCRHKSLFYACLPSMENNLMLEKGIPGFCSLMGITAVKAGKQSYRKTVFSYGHMASINSGNSGTLWYLLRFRLPLSTATNISFESETFRICTITSGSVMFGSLYTIALLSEI